MKHGLPSKLPPDHSFKGYRKDLLSIALEFAEGAFKERNAKRIELIKKSERTPEEEEYLAELQKFLSTALNVLFPLPTDTIDAALEKIEELESKCRE